MSIDEFLHQIRERRLILISENEIYWSSLGPDRAIYRALRKHRKGIKILISWSDIATCPSKDLHRKYWRYAGANRFECAKCKELLTWAS